MSNRLAGATSPYLLQHAGNPVDWWPWTSDALAEAERRDVPVLLSVGYAACHWCHVMAHESFEDQATADKINSSFVPIKVDREERPDIDAVYMQATQAMTGQGGWPMTVFLTPAGDPIYAGTYFPKSPVHGMPAFTQVLDAVSEAWRDRTEEVRSGAAEISGKLAGASSGDLAAVVAAEEIRAAVDDLEQAYDRMNGGFGGAPKFPPSMVVEGLLRIAESSPETDLADRSRAMAHGTLNAMAQGGIYDQLAGGFARYSVDAGWVVPHFEKMLYDNGLLLGCYLHGWRTSGDERLRQVVIDTVDWLLTEMITADGAFAASLDADSRGPDGRPAEGAYYLWNPAQLHQALGPEAEWVAEHCRVTGNGTAEGGNSTLQLGDLSGDDRDRWRELRARLAAARAIRPRPDRDDKVIASWNGLVIDALVESGALLERPTWVAAARRAAQAIWDVHWVDGRLRRTSRAGVPGAGDGNTEDYAGLAYAFVRLAEVTSDPTWVERATALVTVLDDHFTAPDGGFFDVADDAEKLINRPKDPTDNASPSGLSMTVHSITRLATYTGDAELARRAERAAASSAKLISGAPRFAGWLLADAVTRTLGSAVEIAVVGGAEDEAVREMVRLARRMAPAGSVVVSGEPDEPGVPLLADRTMINNMPTAYVCRGFVCRMPVSNTDDLATELAAVNTY